MGRNAEGRIYVIKPLMGRFGSKTFLYLQHIAWSRDIAQETSEYCILIKICQLRSIITKSKTYKKMVLMKRQSIGHIDLQTQFCKSLNYFHI